LASIKNLLIWDGELTPTRIPSIFFDPKIYSSLAEDEKWIICGKWKIKVLVQPTVNGFTISSIDKKVTLDGGLCGSLFLDESFLTVEPASSGVAIVGRFGGCFDLEW
jgi:hypothetical protein